MAELTAEQRAAFYAKLKEVMACPSCKTEMTIREYIDRHDHGSDAERAGFRNALTTFLGAVDNGALWVDDMAMTIEADVMPLPARPGDRWVEQAYTSKRRITFTMTVTDEEAQAIFYADIAKRIGARQQQEAQ